MTELLTILIVTTCAFFGVKYADWRANRKHEAEQHRRMEAERRVVGTVTEKVK